MRAADYVLCSRGLHNVEYGEEGCQECDELEILGIVGDEPDHADDERRAAQGG